MEGAANTLVAGIGEIARPRWNNYCGAVTLPAPFNLKEEIMEGRCMKCKDKKEMKDVQEVTLKNGRKAQQGVCPDCGTKIFKMGAAK